MYKPLLPRCIMLKIASMEVMSYQKDGFVDKLVGAIAWLRLDGTYGTKAVADSKINELLRDRFKAAITLSIVQSNTVNMSMETPPLNIDHPLHQTYNTGAFNDIGRFIRNLDTAKERTGTVNFDNLTLSGVLSKIDCKLITTSGCWKVPIFTDRMIAALILHEIGHHFGNLFYAVHSVTGVFVTSAIAMAAAGAEGDQEREIIFEKGAQALGIDGIKIANMLGHTPEHNAVTLQTLYINDTAQRLRSMTGASIYEAKASEQIADILPTKYGLGVEMAEALNIFHTYGVKRSNIPAPVLTMTRDVLSYTILVADKLAFGKVVPMLYTNLISEFSDITSPYDDDKGRVKYLRNHLIQELKYTDDRHDQKTINDILTSIDKIGKIADATTNHVTLKAYLKHKVLAVGRKMKNDEDMQKQVESLLYNETFVNHAKLKNTLGV